LFNGFPISIHEKSEFIHQTVIIIDFKTILNNHITDHFLKKIKMADNNIMIEHIESPDSNKNGKMLVFSGQLDESNIEDLSKMVYTLIEENPKNLYLLLDFEKLSYMNSKSIGYLTDWYTKVTDSNGKILIAKPAQNILDILNAVGISKFIKCYPTLAEAKNNLFK
jgi:anti-anti-sigma factor